MNWNEGNLARYSRGGRGKDLLLRQKQHFAKAKSGSQKHVSNTNPSRVPHGGYISPIARPRHHHRSSDRVSQHDTARPQKRPRDSEPELEIALPEPGSPIPPPKEEGDTFEKRRKLLMMADWTGLKAQKPTDVELGSRKVTAATSREQRKDQHQPHVKYDASRRPDRDQRCKTPVRRGSIRIRIGSEEMRFGASSNTARSVTQHRTDSRSSGRPAPSSYLRSSSSQESVMGRTQERDSSGHRSSYSNHHRIHRQSSQVIMRRTSSSPHSGILHPIPCRLHRIVLNPLFRSSSPASDADNSMVAQVGQREPVVPPELQQVNDQWRRLMCPSGFGSSDQTSADIHHPTQSNVSPGVSAHGLHTAVGNTARLDRGMLLREDAIPASTPVADPNSAVSRLGDQEVSATYSSEDPGCFKVLLPSGPLHSPVFNIQVSVKAAPIPQGVPTSHSAPFDFKAQNSFLSGSEGLRKLSETSNNLEHPADQVLPTKPKRPLVRDRKTEYEAWLKSFLSDGSSDDLNQQALDEARIDAAQTMQKMITMEHVTPVKSPPRIEVFNTVTLSTGVSITGALASHAAADGSSLSSGQFDTFSVFNETDEPLASGDPQPAVSVLGNVSTFSGAQEHEFGECTRFDGPKSTTSIMGNASSSAPSNTSCNGSYASSVHDEANSVAAQPPQSSLSEGAKAPFKFAAPKLFVGKHASQGQTGGSVQPPVPLRIERGRARGRRKKTKDDGRTDISLLPNYNDDPIEDFDEEIDILVFPESPPLFGSLETE